MASLKETVNVLERLVRRKKRQRLLSYKPYPKQFRFHEAGVRVTERLLMAGSQQGKTFSASNEIAMHSTGLYPDWWPGFRFNKPVLIWTGSPTNETSKEIIQKALLGTSEANMESPDMGTGSIPGDLLVSVTTRQAGVKSVADEILVRHVSGRNSRIALKCHPAGERALMSDGSWIDVKDIKVGDIVYCADGKNRQVTQVHAYLNAPILEIVTRAGSIRGTPNHPVFTSRGKIRMDEVIPGDILEIADVNVGTDTAEDWIVAWTALMIGDGCLRTKRTPMLTCAEPEILRLAEDLLPEDMYIGQRGKTTIDWNIYSRLHKFNRLKESLTKDGLWGLKSRDKFIPQWVFRLNRCQRILFLRWLWTTDGTISTRDAHYDTTSPKLAKDVRLLLWSVGVHSKYTVRDGAKPHFGNRHCVYLSGYQRKSFEEIGKINRNFPVPENFKPRPTGPRGEVMEIKKLPDEAVYGAGVPEVNELIVEGFRVGNTYEQGRAKWQGAPVDVIWMDEEPDDPDLYSEAVTRTNQTNGIVMMTFTPLLGVTDVVDRFTNPAQGSVPRDVTNMTIYDCVGGTWPEDTPWAGTTWTGHYTKERIEEIISSYQDYEKETRILGVPSKGRGRVWKHSEQEVICQPFEIPKHFSRIHGIDFGYGHPAALACLAHDRDTDIVYLYDSYKKAEETSAYHAAAIKARDPDNWIPVAWPHDGMKTEPGSGVRLHVQYRKHGVRMMRDTARYDDDIGGAQGSERFVGDIEERIRTGRFKVFPHQDEFFEEYRNYHRDEKQKIVSFKDDIISALKYAMIELRHAKTKPMTVVRSSRYTSPIVGARI